MTFFNYRYCTVLSNYGFSIVRLFFIQTLKPEPYIDKFLPSLIEGSSINLYDKYATGIHKNGTIQKANHIGMILLNSTVVNIRTGM